MLSNSRQQSDGFPQAITLSDIMAYCAIAGISDPIDRMTLTRCIQAMDRAYIAVVVEKRQQEARARKKG
jgi:hypothetical protein